MRSNPIRTMDLGGIEAGRRVNVFNIDPGTGERLWSRMVGHRMLNQISLTPGSILVERLA
jgi:hypothetical protein